MKRSGLICGVMLVLTACGGGESNSGNALPGTPVAGAYPVAAATVTADAVEHIRGEKKLTFKMKRRKGYHKSIGHRQELTVVKIKEIKA